MWIFHNWFSNLDYTSYRQTGEHTNWDVQESGHTGGRTYGKVKTSRSKVMTHDITSLRNVTIDVE